MFMAYLQTLVTRKYGNRSFRVQVNLSKYSILVTSSLPVSNGSLLCFLWDHLLCLPLSLTHTLSLNWLQLQCIVVWLPSVIPGQHPDAHTALLSYSSKHSVTFTDDEWDTHIHTYCTHAHTLCLTHTQKRRVETGLWWSGGVIKFLLNITQNHLIWYLLIVLSWLCKLSYSIR